MFKRFGAAAFLLAAGSSAFAQLKTIETDRLRVVYPGQAEAFLIPYLGRAFGNSMAFQRRIFDFDPKEKVNLLLVDFSDSGNASAGSVPYDGMTFYLAPASYAYETFSSNERMNTYMNHELVHVSTMDRGMGSETFFRKLFAGKVLPVSEHPESILYFLLTTPRVAVPRWYLEGSAVFFETFMAGGIGRAQGGYDEMVFRAMVKDQSRFYDPLGLVSEGTKIDFQLSANAYLYGTRFMSWLAYTYTPEKVADWVSRKRGSKAYYSSQFSQVFGKSIDAAWRDWIVFEKEFQTRNLEAIRRYPTTPYKDLSKRALGSVSRAWFDPDTRRIYGAFNYPGVVGHVGAISMDDGSVERLVDVKGPVLYTVTSLAYEQKSKTIFYTTDNNAYRDVVAFDTTTKKKRVLLKDARIGDLAFTPADRSLWGIRTKDGICTIVQIPYPWKEWKRVKSWPYGPVVYDLDVSPDGRQVSASVGEVTGQHTLQVFETEALLKGDNTPVAKHDFGTAIPENFVFSPDGLSLYGSSYYTGASNIFRFEIATQKVEALTNTETGFFRPIPLGDDSMIVFRYTGEGFVPARIDAKPLEDINPIQFFGQALVEKHPQLKDWNVGSSASRSFEPIHGGEKPYKSLRSMQLESAYPVIEGYRDFAAFGYAFTFSDPAGLNRATLATSYTPQGELPSNQRLHANFKFQRYDWTARAKWNGADFYDLFGPTKSSRKGYALGLGHKTSLLWDDPREMSLDVNADVFGKLDTLPDFQNVASTSTSIMSLSAKVAYTNLRGSVGKVDPEKGVRWDVVTSLERASGKTFPKLQGSFDIGQPLPVGHASVFLRSAAGYAWGDKSNPLSSFFFGGFGNNRVDRGDEKRYRKWYAFPGAELNAIGGRSFARSTLELNLPPVRFSRLGRPGFFASWIRPAAFAGVLVTNPDRGSFRRTTWDLGTQLDLSITMLSTLDLIVSAGQAVAFDPGGRKHYETMISLKVLR
ncbi:MAG: hypothetical protein ABIR28_09825 [Vicinamibacteria bacterium]